MSDLIDRQAAINSLHMHLMYRMGTDSNKKRLDDWINNLPSAQPERLTDDDFETIRIHLNAYKEKLCNQCRWKEANEYQNLINRFMAFASAQPEIIYCRDCKHRGEKPIADGRYWCELHDTFMYYCSDAERRTDD